jgi:hypothetical protein
LFLPRGKPIVIVLSVQEKSDTNLLHIACAGGLLGLSPVTLAGTEGKRQEYPYQAHDYDNDDKKFPERESSGKTTMLLLHFGGPSGFGGDQRI